MFKRFVTVSHIGKDAFVFCHVVLSLKHPVSSAEILTADIFFFLLLLQLLIAYLQSFNQEERETD
jgi:hypothetical protein